MNSKKIILLGVGIFLVVSAGFWFYSEIKNNNNKEIACTQEAKLCPDGSYVGRSGPKCEFAACPSVNGGNDNSRITAQIGKSVSLLGVTITPQEVIEDSRCPIDVTCIWAGRVRIRTILKSGMGEAPQIFTLGEPITTEAEEITLTSVEPVPVAGVAIAPKDYRFIFTVKNRVALGTGIIQGKVTVGPACPVERIPPDPQCADKPYQTTIEARMSGKTKVVAMTQSDSNGAYHLSLTPGQYDISATSGSVFPRCSPSTVTVESSKTITLNLSCDSGIR